MKKTIMKIFLILMISVIAGSFMPVRNTEAASPKLSTTKKTLYTGENFTLTLKNAKKTVKWKSSNEKVAKVNSSGKVTAIGSGTAKITAKYKSATYTCKVTVKAPHINCKSAELYVDGTLQLEMFGATVAKYSSSDENVAKVSNKGLITAVEFGNATISALCSDGKTYRCNIRVENITSNCKDLSELKVVSSNAVKKLDLAENLRGDIYENVYSIGGNSPSQNCNYLEVATRKEYDTFSGIIMPYTNWGTGYDKCTVKIFGDGKVIETFEIYNRDEPQTFKVDISGVEFLKINMVEGSMWCEVILAESKVQ